MKKHDSNRFVLLVATIAATAGFLFGFDTGNISGALLFIHQRFHTTTFQNEVIVSVTVLSAFFGAISSTLLAKYCCRRIMLIVAASTFFFGAVFGSFAENILQLVVARMLLGLAIGVSSYMAPLYISEISPAKYRGSLVLLNGVAITGGEAGAFFADYLLAGSGNWRMMIFIGCIPALILLIGMFYVPPSPRWLLARFKKEQAKKILIKLRGCDNVSNEINEIENVIKQASVSIKTFFATKKIRFSFIIGLGLGVLQQFSGINTIMYYGPFIFKAIGIENARAEIFATMLMGVTNTIATIVIIFLVDRVGRRPLLLFGSVLAAICLLAMSILFSSHLHLAPHPMLMITLLVLYIIGYCIGIGSLFWVIISEIFPLSIRGFAMAVVVGVQWLANFAVSISFLSMLKQMGPSISFAIYAAVCTFLIIFAYFLVPETKKLSLESIEMELRKD